MLSHWTPPEFSLSVAAGSLSRFLLSAPLVLCILVVVAFPAEGASDAESDTEIAIRVGDVTMTRKRFESNVEGTLKKWLRKFKQSNRTDTPDLDMVRGKIRENMKDRIIRKLLVKNAYQNSDVTVPDTKVQAYWDRGAERVGSDTKFRKQLMKRGITKDTYLIQARRRIKRRRFVKENIGSFDVTEEELQDYYDNNKAEFDNRPLEDVKQRVRKQLRKQKRRKAIDDFIEELRKTTEIEVNIPEQ